MAGGDIVGVNYFEYVQRRKWRRIARNARRDHQTRPACGGAVDARPSRREATPPP